MTRKASGVTRRATACAGSGKVIVLDTELETCLGGVPCAKGTEGVKLTEFQRPPLLLIRLRGAGNGRQPSHVIHRRACACLPTLRLRRLMPGTSTWAQAPRCEPDRLAATATRSAPQ